MFQDFFTLHPESLGIDISDLSIKITKLKKQGAGFELVSYGKTAISPSAVIQGEIQKEKELVQKVKEAIQHVQGEPLQTKFAVASLPEEHAFLQVIQLPLMQKEEVEQAVRFEAENYVPHPLESVYVDYQIVEPLFNTLDHTDVLLAAFPRSIVDSYVRVLEQAGLVPSVLEIESSALARVVVPKETSRHPVLVVDLGGQGTGFTIFSGHTIRFTTSSSFSANSLTHALSKELHVALEKAEELKRQDGIVGEKEIAQVLIPLLGELKKEIKQYQEYYESHIPHQHLGSVQYAIKEVILSGGGAALPGLAEYLSMGLQIPVSLANPWTNILESPVQKLPPLSFQESLRYSSALGLGLRGAQRV